MVMDLQKRFNTLENNNKTFSQNLKASLKREVMKEFEGVIEDIRQEMNNTITTIESKMNNTIKTIESKFEGTIQRYEKLAVEREARNNDKTLSNFRLIRRN